MSQGKIAALIVAGGQGLRFSQSTPKQYVMLSGRPILWHTVRAFITHPQVDDIQVVIHPDHQAAYDEVASSFDLLPVVYGGKERSDSVRAGLEALQSLALSKVLIHDAARPCISHAVIDRVIKGLEGGDAILPVIPVVDTIKQVEGNKVGGTADRDCLKKAQTPQGFDYSLIHGLHERYQADTVTDDVLLCERAGISVQIVPGDPHNIKVTTQADLEYVMSMQASAYIPQTGMGFDAHRFAEESSANHHVMIGGVAIPHDYGIEAHSDGDVVLHALVDAILGAIGEGDIGQHFPPSDEKWKDANSSLFVRHAIDLLHEKGGRVINADMTLIGQRPRIGAYREQICQHVAGLLGLSAAKVNMKATTTEKMGFTGRKEGVAAQAVVTVLMPMDAEMEVSG